MHRVQVDRMSAMKMPQKLTPPVEESRTNKSPAKIFQKSPSP